MKFIHCFGRLTVLLLLLCAGFTSHAAGQNPSDRVIDTGFLPSKDMPAAQNKTGRFSAINGECNGMDELAQAYYQWRKQYPNAPGLADVTELVEKQKGKNYLTTVMDLATEKSMSVGGSRSNLNSAALNPTGFETEILSKLKRTGQPQSIVLAPPPGSEDNTPHRVTIYGAERVVTPQGERWEFKVADSNAYTEGNVDKARLVYIPGSGNSLGRWSETLEGKPFKQYLGGDVIRTPISKPEVYIKLMTESMQGRPLQQIRTDLGIKQEPPSPSTVPRGGVSVVKDPKVGGVMVQFDPALFAEGTSEADLHALEARYRAFMDKPGVTAALFRLKPEELDLHLVPLKGLADRGRTVGGLTRVRGFVQAASGELYLIGLQEAGRLPIPLDDLAVALRAVYADSLVPFISLDPDASNPAGPQRVRIGGLPPELRSTGYVRAMLEADYLMKKINLGRTQPKLAGFKRWVDILGEGSHEGTTWRNRMWLSPLSQPAGDVLVARQDGGVAVLFESHTQVQSEEMKVVNDNLAGTGETSPESEAAAGQYTSHFDELSAEFPEFARLQGVFDITKAAVALKSFGVKSPSIDALLTLKPAAVDVPVTYAGIGPEIVANGTIRVSGGATSGSRVYSRAAIVTSCLSPLLEAAGHADSAHITIPAEFEVDVATAAGFKVEQYVADAHRAVEAGDLNGAMDSASAVLEIDPDHPDALSIRVALRKYVGQIREALADCDRLVKVKPEAYATRALLRAGIGDAAGERADLAEALRLAPDSDEVKVQAVRAYMQLMDFPAAKIALAQLATQAPMHPLISSLRMQLAGLAKRTPEEAKKFLRLLTELPPDVSAVMTYAGENGDSKEKAIVPLEELIAHIEAGEYHIPADLEIPYRARTALMIAYRTKAAGSAEERAMALERVEVIYQKLIKEHPDRGLPHLTRAYLGAACGEDPATIAGYIQKAAARPFTNDPLFPDFRTGLGTNRIVELAAIEMWAASSKPGQPARVILALPLAQAAAPNKPFLTELGTEAGAKVSVTLKMGIDRLGKLDNAAKKQALDGIMHMTKLIPDHIAEDDPVLPISSMMFAFQAILQAQLEIREGFRATAFRAINFLKQDHSRVSESFLSASMMALIYPLLGILELEDSINQSRPLLREFDKSDAKLHKLAQTPNPSPQLVRATMTEVTGKATLAFGSLEKEYQKSLLNVEQRCGPLSRTAVEMLAALVQESTSSQGTPGTELKKAFPQMAGTPEFTRLLAIMSKVVKGLMTDRTPEQLWTKMMSLCHTHADFEAIATYAEVLREMAEREQLPKVHSTPALLQKLQKWEGQARLRAETL
jgi:tetratricopeptide (TPR) repeat protein